MEAVKTAIGFTDRHKEMHKKTEAALQEVSKQIIETAKATDTYIVIADKDGNIIKIPAKDL